MADENGYTDVAGALATVAPLELVAGLGKAFTAAAMGTEIFIPIMVGNNRTPGAVAVGTVGIGRLGSEGFDNGGFDDAAGLAGMVAAGTVVNGIIVAGRVVDGTAEEPGVANWVGVVRLFWLSEVKGIDVVKGIGGASDVRGIGGASEGATERNGGVEIVGNATTTCPGGTEMIDSETRGSVTTVGPGWRTKFGPATIGLGFETSPRVDPVADEVGVEVADKGMAGPAPNAVPEAAPAITLPPKTTAASVVSEAPTVAAPETFDDAGRSRTTPCEAARAEVATVLLGFTAAERTSPPALVREAIVKPMSFTRSLAIGGKSTELL